MTVSWIEKAKMDEMETLNYRGWQFLCSGEHLPSGLYQATVRYREPLSDQILTLILDHETHATSSLALHRAKELAKQWSVSKGARRE